MRASKLRRIPIRSALCVCACNLLAAALAAQCTNPTAVLTNQTVSSGSATYSDNNALRTNAIINGSASITLLAAHCIELAPGFRATAGTAPVTFHAWIDSAAAAPSVTSLAPTSGAVGASVTISGANFGAAPGSVTFNGAAATVLLANWHATSITVQVPQAATTGNVIVTAASGASNGVSFTVIPSITSLSSNSGLVGNVLTINGTTFGTSGAVLFGSVAAAVTSWTNTAIQVTVPSLPVGNTSIVVTAASVSSAPAAFTVYDSAPSISLADPQGLTGLHPNPKLKFTFSDPNGGRDIQWVQMDIGDTMDHACVVFVWVTPNVTNSAINLMSDTFNPANPDWGVQKYFGVGEPGYVPLSNGQCQIDYAKSTAEVIGNNLEISLDVTFYSSYAGQHTMYAMALDTTGLASGMYQPAGTLNLVPPALTISLTRSGNFWPGQTGATYPALVSNAANAGPTTGAVTVTETTPTGLTLVSMTGTGWNCNANTCTRSDALEKGASYPTITVTVNVASNPPSTVVNQVSVTGGSSPPANAFDNTAIGNDFTISSQQSEIALLLGTSAS